MAREKQFATFVYTNQEELMYLLEQYQKILLHCMGENSLQHLYIPTRRNWCIYWNNTRRYHCIAWEKIVCNICIYQPETNTFIGIIFEGTIGCQGLHCTGKYSPRISAFFAMAKKCQGNYMKIHFALALPQQCFCWGW